VNRAESPNAAGGTIAVFTTPLQAAVVHKAPGRDARGSNAFRNRNRGSNVADNPDRRLPMHTPGSVLKRNLNGAQLATLNTLERFGWSIKFVRHVPGTGPKVVLHDPDTHKYAVLDADGVLDENPVWERFRS
jgi:hypothetical protein